MPSDTQQLSTPTTRAVSLTDNGEVLLRQARALLDKAEEIENSFRNRQKPAVHGRYRIGAVVNAAAGVMFQFLADVHAQHPEIAIQLFEDKTIRLPPEILSGALDLAFVRPLPVPISGSSISRSFLR